MKNLVIMHNPFFCRSRVMRQRARANPVHILNLDLGGYFGKQTTPKEPQKACRKYGRPFLSGADEGDRTLVPSLGSSYSTTELHPHDRYFISVTEGSRFVKPFLLKFVTIRINFTSFFQEFYSKNHKSVGIATVNGEKKSYT